MRTSAGYVIRAVPSVHVPETPLPLMPIAPMEGDWDDDDPVDFQDDSLDDTVNVAAEVLEAAVAAERQGTMAEAQRPKLGMGTGSGPVPAMGHPDATPELQVMIRVAGSGAVVTNKGGSEELAGVVAYTHRLVDLVGDLLGLERFIALECVFRSPGSAGVTAGQGQERCLLFTESNGDAVLVRPRPDAEVQVLRDSLGL